MTGYISTAEFNSKISASLILGILNESVSLKLDQYSELCQEIISAADFQQWVCEGDNKTQVLYFLRDLYLNKDSLWFSFFYSEIEYDLVVYILHAAIVRMNNANFELKPQMVDKAYQYCKNEHLINLLKSPTAEMINKICNSIVKSFDGVAESDQLTSIMNDNIWSNDILNTFHKNIKSYLPFLMSHTIYILNTRNAESKTIDQVESRSSVYKYLSDAIRLTNSDVILKDNQESQNIIICDALCKIFSHCVLEMTEKNSVISNEYIKEVFYDMFTIVGLEHVQWFVSDSFYYEIGRSLNQMKTD